MNEIFHYLKFKNLSKNLEKYILDRIKWNFEPIGNSAHTVKLLTLGKALIIYMDYLMFYPNRQHMKPKAPQVQVYKFSVFNVSKNDFGDKLIYWWVTL